MSKIVIAIDGFSSTGKSTIAKQLANNCYLIADQLKRKEVVKFLMSSNIPKFNECKCANVTTLNY